MFHKTTRAGRSSGIRYRATAARSLLAEPEIIGELAGALLVATAVLAFFLL